MPLQTGYIDYDKLEDKALDFRPKMIICGGSAYPREWDYKRLRQIADKVGAYLMSDMAHIRYRLLYVHGTQLSFRADTAPDCDFLLGDHSQILALEA